MVKIEESLGQVCLREQKVYTEEEKAEENRVRVGSMRGGCFSFSGFGNR